MASRNAPLPGFFLSNIAMRVPPVGWSERISLWLYQKMADYLRPTMPKCLSNAPRVSDENAPPTKHDGRVASPVTWDMHTIDYQNNILG